ncbi:MAG: long-chain fatty acid--CoA ligase [Bacteroidetes bacterium HGW-Bacteroidetes-22]|nr:MAG: long-chain fatty acid--CoA ligase [Bacteroidetes bacterium HGW-Bacteroidetes-22]
MVNERYSELVRQSFLENAERTAFSNYEGGSLTYGQVARLINQLHDLFRQAGIKPQDHVALIGKNSSNWATAYMASITYGCVIVPILPNFIPSDVQHIINHSESVWLFTGIQNMEPLRWDSMPALKAAISLDDFSIIESRVTIDPTNTLETTDSQTPYIANLPMEAKMVLLYTSGTMGFSRGVMLSHRSISGNIEYSRTHMPLVPGDKILSFLPLAHAYGCAIEFLYPFTLGCHITFLGKMPTPQVLVRAFGEIKPRLILSVPLIIEKIYKKQLKPIIDKPIMKVLMNIPGINKIIFKKVNKKLSDVFGGNFVELVIGGAPMNEDVQRFLKKIKFRFTVGYGMTECGPLMSYAPWNLNPINACGRVVDQLEMKIDSRDQKNTVGEIMVRGTNVMEGYYRNPEATAIALTTDGWLRTGDLGVIDEKGFLYIKGRSKSMILGANGQNIYPEEIESKINNLPFVAESLVVERRENLVALIYPDLDWVDAHKVSEDHLNHIIEQARLQLNKELPSFMRIMTCEVFKNEFEKTPKRSIKRFLYQQ